MFTPIKRIFSKLRGLTGVRRLKFKKGKQLSLGKILEKQADKRPGKPLILFEDQKISYREFNQRANQVAHLFSSMKFNKGDTVALMISNRPEFLIIHAGLAKVGIIPALINTHIKERALVHALNTAGAKSLILGHEYMERVIKIRDKIKSGNPGPIFLEKEGRDMEVPVGMLDLSLLLCRRSMDNPVVTPAVTTCDPLEYIYTSGTTGLSKATTLTHHKWIQIGLGAGGMCLGAIPGDVVYCCIPLYHNSAVNIAWSITLLHGGTLAIRRKFSAGHFWDDTRKFGCNIFIYVGELCRCLETMKLIKNFCGGSRGAVFSKSAPLAAGGFLIS
jgi:citronellyl-CoA synthetase